MPGRAGDEAPLADRLASALDAIPADDRAVWIRMGMALQDALGADGFDIWDRWSQRAPNYSAGEARVQWRSFRSGRGMTAASVFKLARQNGWRGDATVRPPSEAERRERRAAHARRAELDERKRARAARIAADLAPALVRPPADHAYLVERGLAAVASVRQARIYWRSGVLQDAKIGPGDLCLIMRDAAGKIANAQIIGPAGGKSFLPGGRTKACAFRLRGSGPAGDIAICEGFATAASIVATGLFGTVLAAMSAGQLPMVSAAVRKAARHDARVLVVPDNDEKGTGLKYGRACGDVGLWVPPVVGEDANDVHCRAGLPALAALLQEALACA